MSRFQPEFSSSQSPRGTCNLYCVDSRSILVIKKGEELLIPALPAEEIPRSADGEDPFFIGYLDGVPCYTLYSDLSNPPTGYTPVPIRTLAGTLSPAGFSAVSRGYQLAHWLRRTSYCGACGGPLSASEKEHSFYCPVCNLWSYPPVSPAIITAILKGREILLGHNQKFPHGRYSLIAGFVEPGESLEDCLRREVLEEVGVEVNKIRYLGSQTWPFPHSLMVGFVCNYTGGKIRVDGEEITHAQWFSLDSLPNIFPKGSISRDIMDWCVSNIRP